MKLLASKWMKIALVVCVAICFAGLFFVVSKSISPKNFPQKIVVEIPEGTTLNAAARILYQENVVKSAFFYKLYVVFFGGSKKVMAGEYLFDSPQSALRVAYRTVGGDSGLPTIKITIPEGLASYDIAKILEDKLPGFDGKAFLALAKPVEGKLFPDTYYFYQGISEQKIVEMMTANFERQIKQLNFLMTFSGRDRDEIIKMASIVEKEASVEKDRRIIAGILWKRYDDKYPLQVDAPFFYTLGKASFQLTKSDLASDSPYNLYVNKGLPPTPITNPGLDAILATLKPIKTAYWFYLSDDNGNMHYAETHEGHVENRQKYL